MCSNQVTKGCYIVVIVEDRGLKVLSPIESFVFRDEQSAINEVTRLANSFQGKRFAYFECKGIATVAGVVWDD